MKLQIFIIQINRNTKNNIHASRITEKWTMNVHSKYNNFVEIWYKDNNYKKYNMSLTSIPLSNIFDHIQGNKDEGPTY